MLKRILAALGIVTVIATLATSAIPAFAIEQPSERRARLKIEAQKLPNEANEAMKAKDFDKAITLFTKAIESRAFDNQPQALGDIYFGRGLAYRQKQDCNAAITDFNKALETINKGDIHFSLAACHLTLNQEDLALKDLDNAVKADPDAIMYRSARCKLLFNKKDFAGAVPDCEKALAATPNDKDLLVAAAQSAEQTGNRQRAADLYRQLLAADPGNAIATQGLARVS
jgi:tetratricopeptide (TPR) repeat protein